MDRKRKIHLFKWEGSSGGFTLVEVLVSLAILTIISVALLLLFNQSFEGIIKSGKKAKCIYENQDALEEKVAQTNVPADNESLTMIFEDKTITLHGEIKNEGNLTAFVPNCKKETANDPSVSVTGVELDINSLTLNVGDTHQLTAQVLPENASNQQVNWESSNPEYVEISSEGVVTGIKQTENAIVITVITADGGYTATCKVTVY